MAFLSDRKYSFVSNALAPDTFAVVDVHGEEGLSMCYRFEVTLVTDEAEIDLGSVVQNPATVTIHRANEDDVDFHGILARFEQLHEVDAYVFYRAVLVPKLWWLTLTHHNQVFLQKSVQDLVEAVLKDGGLTSLDFEFRLQGRYPMQEYVCQYGETHFNFMSRWLEREGIYYFFEQTEAGEKIVFTDTAIAHTESPKGGSLTYAPPSGLADIHRDEIVQGLVCRYSTLPQKIRLKDYNYRKPSVEMEGSAVVDPRGRGEVYAYGEHFASPEEGNRLAGIRAQELLCRKEEFMGESTVPYVQPGFTFTLQDHYRESFNQAYLTVSMTHEGTQTGYLISGIAKGLAEREQAVYYRNHFTSIPASTQFRPARTSEIPKITGTLNAKIDAAGTGLYAELDDQGRYKVVLPFDLSGRKGGKASTWLRMIQPYAGSDHGMHFPLHKDTEVLLTFVEGNPDRPVIAGAAPNPETPSPVTSADQTMAKITTSGGNKIHMEDKEGTQRILLHSPTAGTFLRLGAHNDPGDREDEWGAHKEGNLYGAALVSEGGLKIEAGFKNELIMIEETSTILGLHMKNIIGMAVDLNIGGSKDIKLIYHHEFKPTRKCLNPEKTEINLDSTKMVGNETNLKEEVTTLSNAMTTVVVEREEIIENETVIVAELQQVAEGATRITEEIQSLIGEANTIAGSITTIAGSLTEISNEKTELNTNVSRLNVDVTEINANRDELITAINQLAGEKNVISGLINLT